MELTTALAGAKGLIDMAKVALAARDDAKVKEALLQLQDRLYDAQSAALTAVERASGLQAALVKCEEEKRELERQLEDRNAYDLFEVRPGAFVLRSKPGPEGVAPPEHYLCQNCQGKGITSVLRLSVDGLELTCAEERGHRILLVAPSYAAVVPVMSPWRAR